MSELQSIDRYYGYYLHSGRHPLVWRRRKRFEQRRRHNGSANALEVAEKGQRAESERPALFLMCFFFVFAFGDHRDSETSSVHGDARMMTGSARRNMNPSRRYSHMPCSPFDHLPTGYSTHHHSFAEFAPRRRPRWDRRSREILLFDDARASIHTRM